VTDKELDRNAARRLAIIKHAEEVSGNVALTCRYYGISRAVFYRWHRRYQEEGLAGLRDRSKRRLTCPHETRPRSSRRSSTCGRTACTGGGSVTWSTAA
jgi:transposase-like protein